MRALWPKRPLFFLIIALAALLSARSAQAAPYEWTWVAGSSTSGLSPVYGTQGTPAAGNRPPANGGVTGRDSTGKIWLLDANMNIWRYDPATGQWGWLNGGGSTVPALNWGTKGVEAPTNHPGTRSGIGAVWDLTGRLWLYGGTTTISGSGFFFGDLWRYDGATNQWTWMTGTNTSFTSATFGVRNVPTDANNPGMRSGFMGGLDPQGRLVFFGGGAPNPACDVWRYDPATNRWVWLGGVQGTLVPGAYGTQGVSSTSNRIGSRGWGSVLWLPEDGTIWIFGGKGFDSSGDFGLYSMNDLWRFNPASNEWTWMNGASVIGSQNYQGLPGVYGTKGTAAASNQPGSRYHSTSWTDPQGDLWMMGGIGMDSTAPQTEGELNDVWKYSRSTGQWTWMAGANLKAQSAVFGTLGTPSAANTPAGVGTGSRWYDPSGGLRLIGGGGSADMWSFELPAVQEIRVRSGLVDITDGTAFQVTDAPAGGTSQTVLTLTNTGTAALTSLAASLSGTHSAEYSLTGPAVTTLAAGDSTTITISFTPAAAGQRTASLTITSNDADENPYDIALSGTTAAPEIAVEQPVETNLTDGSGSVSLPTTNVGSSSAATTFTLRNVGTADLTGISITKDGTHSGDFSVSTPSASIAPGSSAIFTVTFSPTLSGTRTAAIHITSNDADENPFDITLTGTANGPEINVEYPTSTVLTDGVSSVTLPATNAGSSSTAQTFTIRNTGNQSLTGISITKDGANSAEFTVSTPVTSVNTGSSTTFTVTFSPTGVGGARSAALHIASSDFDENPFDIALTATANAPEIVVEQPVGTGLSDGAATLTFPTTNVSTSSAATTVTIRNTGTGPLTGLSITKAGANPAEFTVGSLGSTTLAAGASTTFNVSFSPLSGGTRMAELRIASNDFDENPFDIAVSGTGNAPEIEVEQPAGTVLVDGVSTVALPAIGVGTTSTQSTFTVRNLGIASLTGISITTDGTNSADFTLSSPGTSIAPGDFAIFHVTFSPQAVGTRTAAIHIFSNDSNESPFDIALTGQGLTPPPGAVDLSYPNSIGYSYTYCVQPDGKLVIGGDISSVLGTTRNKIARLNANNTLDFGFDPGANGSVLAINIQLDGKLLVGGSFSQIAGVNRSFLARLNPNGSPDSAFDPGLNGAVRRIMPQEDGKILIAGNFTTVAGIARSGLARLNADGTLDAGFNPNPNATVYVVRALPDGRIYVGGSFSSIGGVSALHLVLLNADGTVNGSFNANPSSWVTDLSIMSDGKLMIGGFFGSVGGASRSYLARLNRDGTADSTFTTPANNAPYSILPQADGKVILCGNFTILGAFSRTYIGRINGDGVVDTNFNPSAANSISECPILQKNGQLIVPGNFPARSFYLSRLLNDPAAESLEVLSTSQIRWLRGGSAPEANAVIFELSTNGGSTWQPLGAGSRRSGGWEINGLNLPATGQIRARARYTAGGYAYSSSGLIETLLTYSGAVDKPEIAIEQPATNDVVDGGTRDLGSTLVAGSSSLTFTLKNTGKADLTGLSVTQDGANSADFTVSALPASLAAQSSTTFTVTFAPSALGSRSAAIHIASNDEDENSFDITLTGTGISPEVAVQYPVNIPLTDGVSSLNLPTTNIGSSSAAQTFTIRNTGTAPLTGISITKDGTNSAEFTVSTPVTSIAAGASATFTVTFSPTGSGGTRSAAIHIASSDLDENPFDIALTATANAPEIEVEQPAGSALVDGVSTVDFGPVLVGSNTVRTFTIRNTGALTLSSLALSKTGTNSANFTLSSLSTTSLASGGSTTFTVTFVPGATVTRNAIIRVASNDFDENPFDIAVTGSGIAPEIAIEQPTGTNLVDGSSTTSFGSVAVAGNVTQTFTVRNVGTAPLTGLALSKAGTNTADFTLGTLTVTTLNPGESTTFDVTFIPTAIGDRSAILRVASSDDDENPFDINLTGTGLAAEIAVEQPVGTNLTDGGSRSLGSVLLGSSASLTFTIKNLGNIDLTGISITKDGTHADDFTVTTAPTAAVSGPSGSTTFTVQFTPSALGTRTAAIHIDSNDADENPFDILLSGTGSAPEIVVEYPVGTGLTDGVSTLTLPSTDIGSVSNITVTLRNTGSATLTGIVITKDGDNSAEFGTSTPATSLSAGFSTTFSVSFSPTALGTRTAAIHIASSDADENPFDLVLTGTGTSPEVEIEHPAGVGLVDGISNVDYGTVNVGSTLVKTFTVRNTGTSSLSGLALSKTGTNSTLFTLSSLSTTSLAIGANTTFTVTYAPNAVAAHGAIIRLSSNDLDESPFDIAVTGSGIAPEIAIEAPVGTNLTDNGSTITFPATAAGSSSDPVTFTVRNTGSATLTGLALSKVGTNTADFILGSLGVTSLAPAESTTFVVVFTPTAGGTRSATLRVASNDSDENAFDIALSGTATAPTISIEQPANFALTSGSSIIDFGELPPGSPIGRTFRIRNTGTAPLSNIVLTKSGANPGDFTLGTPGATTIAPGAFTTFSVIFNPTSGGYSNATLNIASNATNVSSFSINVTGAGLGPEIEVTASVPFTTVNMVDGAYQLNMRYAAISPPTPNTHWVTITNNGLLDLTGLAFTFSGPASGEYSASTLTTTTLVPGQSTTFSVYFSPSELGERLATLHILSNDHDESSFEIQLKGTGLTRNLAWSIQYFGFSNNGYDPFLIGEYEDHQDPDRDGTPNLLEFATGQHPLNSTTPAQSFTIGTGGECLYTYQRSKAAVADGLIFAVQHNATLDPAGWSSAGVTETILSDDGTLQTVQATIPAPTGGSCFTRLRVQRP